MEIKLLKINSNEKLLFRKNLESYWLEIDPNYKETKPFIEKYINFIFDKKSKYRKHWIFFKNNIIGFIIYYFYSITFEKKGLHIAEFYIKPDFRRNEFGKKVVNLIKKSHSSVFEFRIEVFKENDTAFEFWQKNGFDIHKFIMKNKN